MISTEDLKRIKEDTLKHMRLENSSARVLVGMATCGIASGARPVISACADEISKLALENVAVSQTGCIGLCYLEPIMEVFLPGEEKVTYVKMDGDKARRVVREHIANGQIVTEYIIGTNE